MTTTTKNLSKKKTVGINLKTYPRILKNWQKPLPKRKENKQGFSIILGMRDFKNLLAHGFLEYVISLNGGLVSKKEIHYNLKNKKFYITNWIDDTKQTLTQKQLMNRKYTNIGYALKNKAFYVNTNTLIKK